MNLSPGHTATTLSLRTRRGTRPSRSGAPRLSRAARAVHGYGTTTLGDTEVHLSDYVRVLYKRRWAAITAFLIVR